MWVKEAPVGHRLLTRPLIPKSANILHFLRTRSANDFVVGIVGVRCAGCYDVRRVPPVRSLGGIRHAAANIGQGARRTESLPHRDRCAMGGHPVVRLFMWFLSDTHNGTQEKRSTLVLGIKKRKQKCSFTLVKCINIVRYEVSHKH